MTSYLSKLEPFNFLEKFSILKFTIGSRLINKIPIGIKNSYLLTNRLLKLDIKVDRINETIRFNYLVNGYKKSFSLKRNSSDPQVFEQIIEKNEYIPIVEIFKEKNIIPSNMIDAGANIGLTCLYFKSYFPDLLITALEPSDDTFSRLENNIVNNKLSGVTYLKKGLWSSITRLKADTSFRDGQDWAFRLIEAKPNEEALFETTTIEGLINDFNIETIDFLKIDIEGGEDEVFKDFSKINWLDKVKVSALEIHDEFDCRKHIESNLEKLFTLSHSGELTIGINKSL